MSIISLFNKYKLLQSCGQQVIKCFFFTTWVSFCKQTLTVLVAVCVAYVCWYFLDLKEEAVTCVITECLYCYWNCNYIIILLINIAGVFKPLETISDVRQFVCNSLKHEECPFSLSAFSNVLSDDSISVAQAGLVSITCSMRK